MFLLTGLLGGLTKNIKNCTVTILKLIPKTKAKNPEEEEMNSSNNILNEAAEH